MLFWLESNVTDSKITSRQITFSAFKDIVPVFSQFVIIGMQILQTIVPLLPEQERLYNTVDSWVFFSFWS